MARNHEVQSFELFKMQWTRLMDLRRAWVAMGEDTTDIDISLAKVFESKAGADLEQRIVKAERLCHIMKEMKTWKINTASLTKTFANVVSGSAYSKAALDNALAKWEELVRMRRQMLEFDIETSVIDNAIAKLFSVGICFSPAKAFD